MDNATRSSFTALALVIGLVLTVTGGLLYVSNPLLSENEAIQKATRKTKGPKGQVMYQITDGEINQALSQRQAINPRREGRRQVGEALAVAGLVLLGAGGWAALAAPTGEVRKPDQPCPTGGKENGV